MNLPLAVILQITIYITIFVMFLRLTFAVIRIADSLEGINESLKKNKNHNNE